MEDYIRNSKYVPYEVVNAIDKLHSAISGNDPVNHPSHYTSHPSGVECIEVTRHMNFNLGNVVKYIWRSGLKGGEEIEIEDLEKARWYLDDEISRRRSI